MKDEIGSCTAACTYFGALAAWWPIWKSALIDEKWLSHDRAVSFSKGAILSLEKVLNVPKSHLFPVPMLGTPAMTSDIWLSEAGT